MNPGCPAKRPGEHPVEQSRRPAARVARLAVAWLLLLAVSGPAVACGGANDERPPRGETPPGLEEGLADPGAPRMSTKLERTILGIDVIRVEIRFGPRTAGRLAELAGREPESDRAAAALADSVAGLGLASTNALVDIDILRDLPLDRYLEETRKNLRIAAESGYLPRPDLQTVASRLRPWFSFLEGRDLKEGDRLAYRIRNDTVRTLYWDADGYRLLDQTNPHAAGTRRAVLGGYLAEGVELREGLVESVLEEGG